MALVGVELDTLVSEPNALTTRPPPRAIYWILSVQRVYEARLQNYEYTLSEIFITCDT